MDTFDNILRIFEQISGVKTAAADKPAIQSDLGDYKPGKHSSQTSSMLKDMYPYAVDYDEYVNKPPKATSSPATTDVAFPMEGESAVTKEIKRLDVDPRQFVNKVASASDSELISMFVDLGHQLMDEIERGQYSTKSSGLSFYPQTPQPINVNPPIIENKKGTKQANAPSKEFETDLLSLLLGYGWGVAYKFQKQAEYDADLVGSYLHSFLKSAIDAAESSETEENKEATEQAQEKEEEEEKQDKTESTEKPSKKAPTMSKSEAKGLVEEMAGAEDKKKESTRTIESEPGVESSREDESLDSLSGMNDEELLDNLSRALMELGISPEMLKETGDVGEKLASAVINFQRSGNFRLDPIKSQKKRAAIDYFKAYVSELLNTSRR